MTSHFEIEEHSGGAWIVRWRNGRIDCAIPLLNRLHAEGVLEVIREREQLELRGEFFLGKTLEGFAIYNSEQYAQIRNKAIFGE